jgi:hypothetical protein
MTHFSHITQKNLKNLSYFLGFILVSLSLYFIYIAYRGLDFTDESFYILNAATNQKSFPAICLFSYLAKPLWLLSFKSLFLYRVYGFLIHNIIAYFLAKKLYLFCTPLPLEKQALNYKVPFVLLLVMASNFYYAVSLVTPSYNWFAYVGTLIFFLGYLNLLLNPKSFSGCLFIALAGYLVLFAKPSGSALLLLLAVPLCFHKQRFMSLLIKCFPVLLGLFVLHHFLIQDLFAYYERLTMGFALVRLTAQPHEALSLFRSLGSDIISLFKNIAFDPFNFVILLGLVAALYYKKSKKISDVLLQRLLVYGVFLFFVYNYFSVFIAFISGNYLLRKPVFTLMGLFLLYAVLVVAIKGFKIEKNVQTKHLFSVLGLCFVLPFVASFGTSNDLLTQLMHAAIFWVAGFMFLSIIISEQVNDAWPFYMGALFCVFLVVTQLLVSYQKPYRLAAAYSAQTESVELGFGGALKVDVATKNYIEKLQTLTTHFERNKSTLLDMTGNTPGANVIVGAEFTIFPWMINIRPHVSHYSETMLSISSEETLKKAWIITKKNKENSVRLFMKQVGIDFPADYVLLGELNRPVRDIKHLLYKPKLSVDAR